MGAKKLRVFWILIVMLFLLSLVQASIALSQPKTLYNLGEELSVELRLDAIKQGYLDLDLVCSNGK